MEEITGTTAKLEIAYQKGKKDGEAAATARLAPVIGAAKEVRFLAERMVLDRRTALGIEALRKALRELKEERWRFTIGSYHQGSGTCVAKDRATTRSPHHGHAHRT